MHESIRSHPGHPLDVRLHDSGLWAWFAPALTILWRRWPLLLPFAALAAVYAWLQPYLVLPGSMAAGWRIALDTLQGTVVGTGLFALGYVTLARVEGGPWGHGAVTPWPQALPRLAMLALFWFLVGWMLAWLFSQALAMPWLPRLGFYLFRFLGAWGLYLLLVLALPWLLMLAFVQGLSYVHALRSDESLPDGVHASFGLVFGQMRYFLWPLVVLVAGACLLFHALVSLQPEWLLRQLLGIGNGALIGTVFLSTAFGLAWWFVVERALRPELGLDPDAAFAGDPASVLTQASASGTVGVAASSPGDAGTRDPAELARQLAELEREAGPAMAARRLVAWLRGRRLSRADYAQVRDALADTSAVPGALAGLALEWRDLSRPGELAFLVAEGQRLDRNFLTDRPDEILAMAKRLCIQDQHDLAARLLLPYLDRHKAHADHAEAGVQMARILAFHRDKSEAGLRLLNQLATVHPQHPAILAMIRQLTP